MIWTPRTRVGFRFCFVYLGLYMLATQIIGGLLRTPFTELRGFGTIWPMRDITFWIAAHIFGITSPLTYSGNSIGETSFFWVQMFWILAAAILATVVWSLLDRLRNNYDQLHRWLVFFVRFALAAQMFEYGMTKIIPNQFRAPPLVTLVQPVGNQTLEGLLWASIGAAPGYEIFLGCAEMLGGLLLLTPRTTMLGALLCLADMIHVFVLNMTYDIGLKQVSFHLILLCLFLLATDFKRLVDFFFPRRPTTAVALQIAIGVYLIGTQAYINWSYWHSGGGGAPKSALYGIWNVEQIEVDGQIGSAALQEYDRQWRRVIFDVPGAVAFQRTDDSIAHYGASIDSGTHSLALTKGSSKLWKSTFQFERPAADRLMLDGNMDSHRIRLNLSLVDFDSFPLLNSTFRWVRPERP